jgi:hypothetical protein
MTILGGSQVRFTLPSAFAFLLLSASAVQGYIEIPYTMGRVVNESQQICLVEITKLDKDKGLIIYKKLKDIKGVYAGQELKHNIGKRGFHAREWQTVMGWAAVGKKAVFFSNGGASETCTGSYWYQCYKEGDWWGMSHAEPFLLRAYCGDAEKLGEFIGDMLQNKEVVIPCMFDEPNRQLLHDRKGKMQLMKASLKLNDYNAKRDFVGWGGDPVDIPQYKTVILLTEGADGWKYNVAQPIVASGSGWTTANYNDAAWTRGKAPLGYGEDEINKRKGTTINLSDKGKPFVFRNEFTIPAEVLQQKDITFKLEVASDNSATVYLNGKLADQEQGDHEFAYWNRDVELKRDLLLPGKNTIAVLVDNGSGSSDIYLDAQVSGLILLPKKVVAAVKPANQPPATSLAEYNEAIPAGVKVNAGAKEIVIPAQVAPRKLPNLKEIYPIEVFATHPSPKGQKAHETVIVFDNIKPIAVHKALASLGLKPGQPAFGEGKGTGPELQLFLEFTHNGQTKRIPVEETLINTKTNQPVPALKWHFTGSNLRQPDPTKKDYVYGANVTGTLISMFPVTNDCVIQSGLSMQEESQMRLEVRPGVLPAEGSALRLVIRVK